MAVAGGSLDDIPIVVNTWPFTNATQTAWDVLSLKNMTAVDAVVAGCSTCERLQCDGTVGYGGSPDEHGESYLDAMIMDGKTHDVGAVGGLRQVKSAIAVAHAVMKYTKHTLLVGDLATEFALEMRFPKEDLHTNSSVESWRKWKENHCQPNFWQNVIPDPTKNCGPYTPIAGVDQLDIHSEDRYNKDVNEHNHDTIGMIAVDINGDVAAGTSTNGAGHKIPGRVGDSPIMGAGSYADNDVGGAAATGDGDVMMRFLPTFHAVELMRGGATPTDASLKAIAQIKRFYPQFSGAVLALRKDGTHGAACNGMGSFHYSVRTARMSDVQVVEVKC